MSTFLIYVTYPSVEEAREVSRRVVEQRLAACANIFPGHESVYWWDDEIESGQEVAVIYKTTLEQFSALKDKIVTLHSFDVPCVVALPISDGHAPFLEWIGEETKSA